jgi:hypothetical protein
LLEGKTRYITDSISNRTRRIIILGRNREEVVGGWRRLQYEEVHNLHIYQNIGRVINSRKIRWAGNVARMEAMINAYSILVGKSERKRPLGRPRRRWEDNIRMALTEIVWEGVDWIHLAQDRKL